MPISDNSGSALPNMPFFLTKGQHIDHTTIVLIVVPLLIVTMPLDGGQLIFAIVGSFCYAAVQASRRSTRTSLQPSNKQRQSKPEAAETSRARMTRSSLRSRPGDFIKNARESNPAGRQDYKQESTKPVVAPTFKADDFDTQVEELVAQIVPSVEGDKLVQNIAVAIKKGVSILLPEAEVMGFATGDVLRGTAFAVAIPEVDIILTASPSVLVESLKSGSRPIGHASKLDLSKLQKAVLRACTDVLTAIPGFKFRRSAFKGTEPKVTLMVEMNGRTFPVDFSINAITPLHNAALLTECGHIDQRAKELTLLVRRWAKDRGISHAAKSHLSPYAWSLLAIYFLQVWDGQEPPLLPNITCFKMAACLLRKQQQRRQSQVVDSPHPDQRSAQSDLPVAFLFKEFFRFYAELFDWRNEAVSVRVGKRGPAATPLPLHIVTLENGSVAVAPSIEDPFEPQRNLADAMTGVTYGRLREEFARGLELTSQDLSLSEVLTPWVPQERAVASARATRGDEDSDV